MSNDMLHAAAGSRQEAQQPTRHAAGGWVAPQLDRCLNDFLDTEILALGEIDPALVPFATVARDLARAGGKRLRPAFAYWGWRGAAGPDADPASVAPALAALELLHTFALIHDDVMDRGAVRRGRPAAHRGYAAAHSRSGWRGDAEHFGTSAAILAGDLCLVWADRLIAEAPVPAARLTAARAVYDLMRIEAVAGQYLDLLGEATPDEWDTDRALTVARFKSASYTVVRPLEFGAALAGDADDSGQAGPDPENGQDGAGDHSGRYASREALLSAYRAYGTPLGEAFQLRDDVLGLYGDPSATGKPTGDDLRRGKPTALVTIARQRADALARDVIDRCLHPEAASAVTDSATVARLGQVITATGARAEVEAMIDERVRAASAALRHAPVDGAVRDALTRLARAVAYRST